MSEMADKPRLKRLLESGLCASKNIQEHMRELKTLVKQIDGEDIKRQAYVLKALADATRIKLLYLLKNRPMCTCEITVALGVTEANVSHHLSLLERNNIVKSEKTGKWVFYSLDKKSFRNLVNTMSARANDLWRDL